MTPATFLLSLVATAACPGDWPCWRGPSGDGVSRETEWVTKAKEAPLWTLNVGHGHSSSSVAGERLFTLGFDSEADCDRLWCLDARTGEVIWTAEYPASLDAHGHGGGTHTTPSVHGDTVYVTSRRGEVRAYDMEQGELKWEHDLPATEGVRPNDYGYGGSPLVVGKRVIVNASKTFALDIDSGEVIWSSADRSAFYSTPARWNRGERGSCLASFSKEGLTFLTETDGKELGFIPWRKGRVAVNASTPVVVDASRIFFSSAYDHGCALLRFDTETPEIAWESKVMRTKMSGCVLVGERLFGFDEAMLKAIGLDGQEHWRKRGLGMGALSAAGERLLVLSGKGELVIVAAQAKRYTELSRRRLFERGPAFWSAPVLANGLVYCRAGDGQLVCLDHRPGS